jgi:hypothetical protein
MVDALTKKLNDSVKCSTDLVSKLTELDELIDEEKRKWKQQVCIFLICPLPFARTKLKRMLR